MIRPEDWTPVDGLRLEPNALTAATTTTSNMVVTAGPGAGKTELLAQRADFLFRTGTSAYPQRILAISFKVDAARNLQTRVRLRSGTQYAARFDSFTFHAFAKRIIDNFRPALTGQSELNADYRLDPRTRLPLEQITYDDLVPLAVEILQSNAYARGALRQTYSHVFMDEFQDATASQYAFLRLAFGETGVQLTGVGDTKQRIMVFAGALEGVMKTYATDFDAVALQLYQNFRSKPRLRRMQNRMVQDMDPEAASPPEDLEGEEGVISVLSFDTDEDEAEAVADLIAGWLEAGVPPHEMTVLVRQQPHLVAAVLGAKLTARGIPYRNEQASQDLTAEPVAALILNYLRVVADDRRPDAYTELMRIVTRGGVEESDGVLDSRLQLLLTQDRRRVRADEFDRAAPGSWNPLVLEFLALVTRPVLNALSPSYQQGTRLDAVVKEALEAFARELQVDGDPLAALRRLSEEDAIRILTVHKCKGLEFEKVIVLGVETDLFWGNNPVDVKSEFFVAVSRAKNELVLTHAEFRSKPDGANWRWNEERTAHAALLAFAIDL